MSDTAKSMIGKWGPWVANIFIALLVYAGQGWTRTEIESATKNCITRNEFVAYTLNRAEQEKARDANLNERLTRIEASTRAIPEMQRSLDQINYEIKGALTTLRKDFDEVQTKGSPITRERLLLLETKIKELEAKGIK